MAAVSSSAITTRAMVQLPRMRSASSLRPLPIMMEARGAPPMLASVAKALTSRITGIVTPRPVSAVAPTTGT